MAERHCVSTASSSWGPNNVVCHIAELKSLPYARKTNSVLLYLRVSHRL